MEEFKKRLKIRIILLSVGLIAFIAANIILSLTLGQRREAGALSLMNGFQIGLGAFFFVLLVLFIIQYAQSVRSEVRLKQLYIEETDERKLLIYQKSGAIGINAAIIGLAGASILSGYFNTTVFITLLSACLFVSVIRGVLKLYYRFRL